MQENIIIQEDHLFLGVTKHGSHVAIGLAPRLFFRVISKLRPTSQDGLACTAEL